MWPYCLEKQAANTLCARESSLGREQASMQCVDECARNLAQQGTSVIEHMQALVINMCSSIGQVI